VVTLVIDARPSQTNDAVLGTNGPLYILGKISCTFPRTLAQIKGLVVPMIPHVLPGQVSDFQDTSEIGGRFPIFKIFVHCTELVTEPPRNVPTSAPKS
jgi:hypothetical protein